MPKKLGTPDVIFSLQIKKGRERQICPIIAKMQANWVRYYVSIGDGCKPSEFENGRPKLSKTSDPARRDELEHLNKTLDWWEATMKQVWRDCHSAEIGKPVPPQVSKERFQELVYAKAGYTNEAVPRIKPLLEFANDFVQEELKKTNNKKRLRTTAQSLRLHYIYLVAYCKQHGRLNYEAINFDWFPKFTKWLYTEVDLRMKLVDGEKTIPDFHFKKKALEIDSASQALDSIKRFVREARKRGYTENRLIDEKSFSIKSVRKRKAAFTIEELIAIYETDFSQHPKAQEMEETRILTFIGALTGLRNVDWGKGDADFVSDGLMEVLTQKTGASVGIRFFPLLQMILDKINWSIPNMTISAYNKNVKQMCRCAGIDSPILHLDTSGGVRDVSTAEKVEKWRKVSSHYCRRFFIRNMLSLGKPAVEIMAMTGHKTEAQMMEYADLVGGLDLLYMTPDQKRRATDFLTNGSEQVRPMAVVLPEPKKPKKEKKQAKKERPIAPSKRSVKKRKGSYRFNVFCERYNVLFERGHSVYLFDGKPSTEDRALAEITLEQLRCNKENFARIFTGYVSKAESGKIQYSIIYKPRKSVAQLVENV